MTVATGAARIEYTDERLANGLRLLLVEDHLVPVTGVSICYDVGSRHDPTGRTGLAHLFEHLMFQGSAHVAKMEHFALVSRLGGNCGGGTGHELTVYGEELPSHHLELALWMEADRMGTLADAVTQEALDNQRDVVINERLSGMDNAPYGTCEEALAEALYPPGSPYRHSIIGSIADIRATTLDDVRAFFRRYYAPNNAALVIAGDLDPGQAREWVERHFGWISPDPDIPPPPDGALPPQLGGEFRQVIEDRVPLSRVYVGYRAPPLPAREVFALQMALYVLEKGRRSRVSRRLLLPRLAQEVALELEGLVGGPSFIKATVTAAPGQAIDDVEAAFHESVQGLSDNPPGDEELDRVRVLVERMRLDQSATAGGIAGSLSVAAAVHHDPERANADLDEMLSITADEIRLAAAEFMHRDNRVVITYVPGTSVATR